MPSVTFERFRGLNLVDDPGETGGETAQDLLNVEFDKRGRVSTRRGYAPYDSAVSPTFNAVTSGAWDLFAFQPSGSADLDIFSLTSGIPTNLATLASAAPRPAFSSAASIGTGTATYTFLATWRSDTSGAATLQRATQAFPGTPTIAASTGKPKYVAGWNTRLVQAMYAAAAHPPSGANGSTSTVFFSNAGDPNTYTSTDWVMLNPGDGEEITGMAVFNEQLYVFKQSAVYIFSSTLGIDATGGAVFNYRRMDLGCQMPPGVNGSLVAVGADGLYVVAYEGVFRVTSVGAVKVSQAIDPLFDTTAAVIRAPKVWWVDSLLYLRPFGGTYPLLVFDPVSGEWVAWDLPIDYAVGYRPSTSKAQLFFIGATSDSRFTTPHVQLLDRDYTTDNGTAISWRWQSGWYDLGGGEEALTRETTLWGSGTATVAVLTDYATTDTRAAAVTLGTAPTVAEGVHQQAYTGVRFSHKLSGTGSAMVAKLAHTVRSVRAAGLRA